MPITPVQNNTQRDSEGYELDAQGNRIYPHWAGYVPAGAKTTGGTRPPWVPSIANYWDESKPPRGWFKLTDGSWGNIGDEEHVKAHPELTGMMMDFLKKEEEEQQARAALPADPTTETTVVKDVVNDGEQKPTAPPAELTGIRCKVCEKPFPNAAMLMVHMKHHKKSDQHHADAVAAVEGASPAEEVKK